MAWKITTLARAGDAVPLLENPQNSPAIGAAYAVSSNGALLSLQGGGAFGGVLRLVEFDATGRREPPIHAPLGTYLTPKPSPDGMRVAFSQAAPSGTDMWVKDIERDTALRLSFLPGNNHLPVWTPDGRHIVFRSAEHGAKGLHWIRADGSGNPHRLTDGTADEFPYSFSPDGKRVGLYLIGEAGSMDVATANLEGDPDRGRPRFTFGHSAGPVGNGRSLRMAACSLAGRLAANFSISGPDQESWPSVMRSAATLFCRESRNCGRTLRLSYRETCCPPGIWHVMENGLSRVCRAMAKAFRRRSCSSC